MNISYDIFISYRRIDSPKVQPLVDALERRGVKVWMDKKEIEDFTGITASISEGLSNSKALVAWFSSIYPLSRPCQWELTTAFLASQQEGAPRRRVLIINPEQNLKHIYLPELKDQQHITAHAEGDVKTYDAIAESLAQHISGLEGTLGEIQNLTGPVWFPSQAVGSNRFVGQLKRMWEIHKGLWQGNTVIDRLGSTPVVRLVGMGGTGKSLLAEEYALRFGAAYPGGVFWLTMPEAVPKSMTDGSFSALRDSAFRSVAAFLGIGIKDKDSVMIQGEMGRNFGKQGSPFLWVVDDVPSGVPVNELNRWFAPHPLGRTIITTRSREYGSIGSEVEVDELEHGAAIELLTGRQHPGDDEEKQFIGPILEKLGHHALAIDVAGARLETTSYASFFRQLADPGKDALELAAQFADQLPNGHEASIVKTLLESIKLLDDDAMDFLRIASLLQVYRIPAALIIGVFAIVHNMENNEAKDRADLAIHKAKQQSLADGIGDEDFSMFVHALVSRTMRFLNADNDWMDSLRKGIVKILNKILPAVSDIRNHQPLEPWIIQAQYLTENVNTLEEAKLLNWVGIYYLNRGSFKEAESVFRKEYSLLAELIGEEHADTLTSMNNLANSLLEQGNFNKARILHEKVVEVNKQFIGEEHPDTLKCMNNLANTLVAQGDFNGARVIQERVLELRKRIFGEENFETLVSMNNLAETFREQGDFKEASALHKKVFVIGKQILGMDHPNTLMSMNNLALSLHGQGDFTEARTYMEKALGITKKIFGENHPKTLTSMNNLAEILRAQGNLDEAKELQENVLEQRKRVLGEEHPDTLSNMNNLAEILRAQGNLDEAKELQENILEQRKRVLGEEHPDTLSSMNNLAGTLQLQGDFNGAKILQEKVLSLNIRILGENHPNTLKCMNNLAGTLQLLGDFKGARVLNEKVLEARQLVLGEQHPDTLTSINNLADSLRAQGNLNRAQVLYENVLRLRIRILGEDHLETLTSMNNLAETFREKGDLNEARELHEKTLECRQRVLRKDHPDILTSMNNLALTLSCQGDFKRARVLQQKVLEVNMNVLGKEHPHTTASAWNLFCTFDKIGEIDNAQDVINNNLIWLFQRDPSTLGALQKKIRDELMKVGKSKKMV